MGRLSSFAAKAARKAAGAAEKDTAGALSVAAKKAERRAAPKPKTKPAPKPERKATINIGLNPSTKIGGKPIKPKEALDAVRGTGRKPLNVRRVVSQSEPTLVVDVDKPFDEASGTDLSALLRQDAIAQHLSGGEGSLFGPAAAEWGDFNPAMFYVQGGDTLGSGLMTDKFRAGAPRGDIAALADKWGIQLDPVALDVNMRLRDEAMAGGQPLGDNLGQFTGRSVQNDPDALSAYRIAQRQLIERQIAEQGRETFGLRDLPQYLDQLPPEEELQRILRQSELPQVGVTPDELAATGGRGVHISTQPGLSTLDPSYYGAGHRGAEYAHTKAMGLPDRTYMYVGPEGTVSPEPVVLGVVGDEMRRGPRYAYQTELEGLYDINDDPERVRQMAQAMNLNAYKPTLPDWVVGNKLIEGADKLRGGIASADMERWIKDRGYAGYLSDFGPGRAAALYGPTDVTPIDAGPITDWRRKFAEGGLAQ